jgi:imidazolonepropionase-like amidohydrolase
LLSTSSFFDETEKGAFKSGFLDAYFGNWDDPTIAAALERHRKELKSLVEAGARVTAGTDSPFVPYGFSLITELLSSTGENGLTEAQALLSSTAWAAEAMGAGDQLGRIEEGYLADLIIVRGDPLQQIEDLLKVSDVISRGRHFTVSELMNKPDSKP